MLRRSILAFCLCALLLSIGCAPKVKRIPATLIPISQAEYIDSFNLSDDLIIVLHTGYKRKLKRGARWNFVGKIPEGNVFKSNDQLLTVEGAHVHEAYLVISNGQLVGFYLPVEKAFSALPAKLSLPIK